MTPAYSNAETIPLDGAEYGRRMHVPAGRYHLIGTPLIPRLPLRGHRNQSNVERGSFGKQHRVAVLPNSMGTGRWQPSTI